MVNRKNRFFRLIAAASVCLVATFVSSCNAEAPVASPIPTSQALNSPIAPPASSPSTPPEFLAEGIVRYSGGAGRLAFATDLSGSYQIGVLDMKTGDVVLLTSSPEPGDVEPRWSADGDKIYFVSGRDQSVGYAIYTMQRDGSNQKPLVQVPGRNTINAGFALSPDGKQAVFHSNRDGNFDIYLVDITGDNLRRLTNHPSNDVTPIWSPNGTKIIFASDREGNEYQLFEMDADGSNVASFISAPGTSNYSPRFSPNGQRLAFVTRQSLVGTPQIAVYEMSTGRFDIVTNGFDFHAYPDWIDDRTLVYASRVSEGVPWSIYKLDFEKGVRATLLAGGGNFTNPAWIGD